MTTTCISTRLLVAATVLALVWCATALRPTADEDKGKKDTAPLLDTSKVRGVSLASTLSTALNYAAPATQVQTWVASAVGLSSDQLVLFSDVTDEFSQRHVRFSQVQPFAGGQARVLGGDLIVHMDQATNAVYELTGSVVDGITAASVKLPPSNSLASSKAEAVKHVKANRGRPKYDGARTTDPEVVVVPSSAGLEVGWCSTTDLTEDDSQPAVISVCTEGHGQGKVREARNVMRTAAATGTAKTLFSGSVPIGTNTVSGGYELRDPTRTGQFTVNYKAGSAVYTDADNVWGNSATSDSATVAGDAHYGMRMAYDYYKNVLGRNGIDGSGLMRPYSRVHYGSNYINAFWSDSCNCMTYGDGYLPYGFKPLVSLDVAGHEMTHGVTSRTANLYYGGESGGLNEAMSDIFGTMIEFYANSAVDRPDYYIGEMLYTSNTPTTADPAALRYMFRPSKDGSSPDCWYAGLGNLDVHYSSGPANHWFYLLAEGSAPAVGPLSPTCNGRAVVGIGRLAAAKITYRALSVYMSTYTTYSGARTATLRAAADLYGSTSAQYARVNEAWAAISVTA